MKNFFAAALLIFLLTNGAISNELFKVVKSDQTSFILELTPYEIWFDEIEINGSAFHKINSTRQLAFLSKQGCPQVVVVSVPIGIPFLAKSELRIVESQFIDIPNISLIPAPTLHIENNEQGNNVFESFSLNPEIYQSDRLFPLLPAELSHVQIIRNRKIVKIHLFPLQYNPAQKTIRQYTKLKVEILYQKELNNKAMEYVELEENAFDKSMDKLVVNYQEAKFWKKGSSETQLFRKQPEWYSSENINFKLFISRDGIYRLYYNDLQAPGISLETLDPSTLRIFNKGIEIPLHVSGEDDGTFNELDFLEFYAKRNYSETSYYDEYSDTNIYWLTFGGEKGKRFEAKSRLPGDYQELRNFRKSVHIEKDESYYFGDRSEDIYNTEMVSGEGWIWKEFYVNEIKTGSTYLENVNTMSAELCTLNMRLRGMTFDSINPDHMAQISINNQNIAEVAFDNFESIVYTTTFQASVLKNGKNDFSIRSIDTGADINKFYFDWLDLSYPASFLSTSEEILFSAPENQDVKISIWNLNSESVSVYNLSKNYYISDVFLKNEQRFVFRLLSAGFDDGNNSRIQINSSYAIDFGFRGHNMAVFDTSTGLLDEVKSFDTLDNTENSDSMATYISQITDNKLVLVSIRDEGSYSMTEAAHQAMETLGSAKTREVGFRDSYVLLGRKGASPGTVPELLIKQGQGQAVLVDTLYTFHLDSRHLEFNDMLIAGDEIAITGSDSMRKPDLIVVDNFQNLKNIENGADYIFITHKNFQQTANHFSAFWESKSYRTKIVDIEDIYDEFNYGIKHAKAIKNFLAYTYKNWKKPAPTFVLLIGDASWDPKKNSFASVKEDFIPTWGNPVSDNWFVCFDGKDDILPDMFIGRLAIATAAEGETIFNKVKNYSELLSNEWKKKILFINGGFDDSEQTIFGRQSQGIIENYVSAPPSNCVPYVISKELDGLYEGEKREDIIKEINDGKLWVNFIGHGGSGTWELMFHDEQIFQLNNGEHLPFVSSLTCHTGRFANPEITNFGENFVNYSEAGAIGFTGSSGWGFVYEDEVFAKKLFETVLKDTVRQMGAALTLAKIKFWEELYPTTRTESVVHQYSLLGDPALKLTLPESPELVVKEKDINWLPISPVEIDSLLEIGVNIHNYGLNTSDSVQIKVTDNFQLAGQSPIFNKKINAIGHKDSVKILLNIKNKPGEHLLNFIVDPENNIMEENETNNQCSVSIFVASSRITISKPGENQVVNEPSPMLQINNVVSDSKNSVYYFEIDSTNTFDSHGSFNSGFFPEGTIVTNWRPPQLQPNTTYYWKCRKIEDSVEGNWIFSNFFVGEEFGWYQKNQQQFTRNIFDGVELTSSGVMLKQNEVKFRVESSGFKDLNYVIIFINATPLTTTIRGHSVVLCDRTGTYLESRDFDTHGSPVDVAAMVEFIQAAPTGYYILAGIRDSGEQAMTEPAYQALESIGSQYCRDVEFRDGWAIIGKKGALIGSVPEKIAKRFSNEAAIVEDTVVTFEQSGSMVTNEIGPSNGWKNLSWEADSLSSDLDIKLDVIALNKTTLTWETLLTDLSINSGANLSAIDSKVYPLLKLKAKLFSESKLVSPVLNNWKVIYDPVSDMAISDDVVKFNSDTLIEGALLQMNADVYNVGYIPEDSIKVELSYKDVSGEKIKISEALLNRVEKNDFINYSVDWNTAGQVGTKQLLIEIDPQDEINELSENNNLVIKKFVILADTVEPEIDITYDDKTIISQDYVAPDPEILIRVYDNSPAAIQNDTTRFQLLLDGVKINYFNNEQTISLMSVENVSDSTLKAQIRFTPHLIDGDHTLDVIVRDVGENYSSVRDEFKVISDLKVLNVLNYPNPFDQNTNFTFHLTQPVDRVLIKIFTVAGRLIHKMEHSQIGAGFQQIFWDGRDRDGDRLANGVYLYKVIVTANGKQKEKIEKLVVMR
jgi:hypothetical protein